MVYLILCSMLSLSYSSFSFVCLYLATPLCVYILLHLCVFISCYTFVCLYLATPLCVYILLHLCVFISCYTFVCLYLATPLCVYILLHLSFLFLSHNSKTSCFSPSSPADFMLSFGQGSHVYTLQIHCIPSKLVTYQSPHGFCHLNAHH